MIVTDNTVHQLIPRTGTVYTGYLLDYNLSITEKRNHTPLHDVPEHYLNDRSVVCNLRDPWSWYVSYWINLTATRQGKQSPGISFDEYAHAAFLRPFDIFTKFWKKSFGHIHASVGLYTVYHLLFCCRGAVERLQFPGKLSPEWYYDHNCVDHFPAVRDLHHDLESVYGPLSCPPGIHQNRSQHMEPMTYYSESLQDMVYEHDEMLINIFGF